MRIVQVNTKAIGGGAERIALTLHQRYQQLGHQSKLIVGHPPLLDTSTLLLPNEEIRQASAWYRIWHGLYERLQPYHARIKGTWRLGMLAHTIADPQLAYDRWMGYEHFDFPATAQLFQQMPYVPQILHLHNLHGGFFDLTYLPTLTKQIPTVITLHDTWLLSGHCAYSNGCDRWQIGCGHCPDLTLYPSLQHDGTAHNWQRKQAIFQESRLHLISPSQWLMDQVERSILAPAIQTGKVIYNGVDLSIFKPILKASARTALNLPTDAAILLFSGALFGSNPYKDYGTIRAALEEVAQHYTGHTPIVFVALGAGENLPTEQLTEQVEIRYSPFQSDPHVIASYYQAADLFLHAAKSDNFPTTILEALACGVPVIATVVGGIPEQVDDLGNTAPDHATGRLVPLGDSSAMARAILQLLGDDAVRNQLGQNAAQDAQKRFDVEKQVQAYLDYYQTILED